MTPEQREHLEYLVAMRWGMTREATKVCLAERDAAMKLLQDMLDTEDAVMTQESRRETHAAIIADARKLLNG